MDKRLMTKKQERAFRLCHHNFEGLTQEEAAKIMGVSRRAINFLLLRVEKVLPQYFPIISKQEAKIYHYYMIEGWEVKEIAEHTGLTQNAIIKTFQRLRDKGMYFAESVGRILSYDKFIEDGGDGIDNMIKHKF